MKLEPSLANRCAIRLTGGDVYIYLFPMYVKLGYAVRKLGAKHLTCPTVCFVGDGATGKIMSFALALGHSEVSLFHQAVMRLYRDQLMNASGVQHAFFSRIITDKLCSGRCKLEVDALRPSLDRRILKKTSIINQDEVGDEFLKYLYDWSLEDHSLEIAACMDLNCALRIIDAAILRFNETRVSVASS